jgi:hypothetical protein
MYLQKAKMFPPRRKRVTARRRLGCIQNRACTARAIGLLVRGRLLNTPFHTKV